MAENKHLGFDAQTDAESGDDGFTLIELMVVVLVIAILLAIAVPTFLGARERSQDRAAQSSLRNALTAAKVSFVDTGDYRNANETNLKAIEPSIEFIAGTTDSDDEDKVSVAILAGDEQWSAAAMSESETCWWITDQADSATGGVKYGSTTTAASCAGTDAAGATLQGGWRTD